MYNILSVLTKKKRKFIVLSYFVSYILITWGHNRRTHIEMLCKFTIHSVTKASNIEINVTIRISIKTKHNNNIIIIICRFKTTLIIWRKKTHNRINERFSLFFTSKDIFFVDILSSWYSRRSLAAVLFFLCDQQNKTKKMWTYLICFLADKYRILDFIYK